MKAYLPFLKKHGMTVFGLILLVAAVYVVQREFRTLSVADIRAALDAIPQAALWKAAGWTLLAYAVLTIYDRLGKRLCRPSGQLRAHLAGVLLRLHAGAQSRFRGGVGGCGALPLLRRLGPAAAGHREGRRLHQPHLRARRLRARRARAAGGAGRGAGLGDHVPHWLMRASASRCGRRAGLCDAVAHRSHITVFGHRIDLPGFRMALAQTLLASVDVAVTAMIFYTLLPPAEGLTFLRFLGIYIAAYLAGIAASLPGGIGVFDTAILLGLQPWLSSAEVIGALLVFRLYYYIVPLFLAGVLFAGFEVAQRREMLLRFRAEQRVADALEVPAIAGLVGLAGAVLIFLGGLPTRGTAIWEWAGYEAAVASHFASSVVGSLLLVMAYGLLRRLRLAWGLGILLLLNGVVICILRGEAWWLWGAFLLVAVLLGAMRGAFYRDARLIGEPMGPETVIPLAVAGSCAILLALVSYGGRVAGESWWEVVVSPLAPDSLRLTVGLAALLLFGGMIRLLRPARIRPAPWKPEIRARLHRLGAPAPEAADGAVFGEAGLAGFAFLKRDTVWLALGDPAGDEKDRVSAIWRFRDMCDRAGVDPAFWRVTPALLRVYGDIGLTAFPLGAPGPGEAQRYLACRAEKDLEKLMPLLPAEPVAVGRR
jgi:phosphatidylglycerol lysyltransferase